MHHQAAGRRQDERYGGSTGDALPVEGLAQGGFPARSRSTLWEGKALEYPASIKVHNPCREGVLVELAGEFDISCLEAFEHALRRASGLRKPMFVDLAGVTFMDALCLRELAEATGTGRLALCRPSWQFMLGLAACGLEKSVMIVADDDPGYEAVIAEACKCAKVRRSVREREQYLYVRAC